MEGIKKHNKYFLVAFVFLVSVLFLFVVNIKEKKIDSYITEKNIVYTPDTLAVKSHKDIISIDTFNYWIFKLNDEQKAEISEELDNGNWSQVNNLHLNKLSGFLYEEKEFEPIIYNSACKICVYDDFNGRIVTSEDKSVYDLLTQTIIFVYEPENGYYICIHITM